MGELIGVVDELFCLFFGAVGEGLEKAGLRNGCLAFLVALVVALGATYLLVALVFSLAR